MSSFASVEPASSSTDGRGPCFAARREFWLGLTTPDVRVLRMAALLLVGALIVASFLAREERVEKGVAADWLDPVWDDYARSSFYAMQGAGRQAAGPGPTVVFVGASALRFWLPPPEETNEILRSVLGDSARGLILCGNAQSYPLSAALIERFGWEFSGAVVVGVDRNMIGRELNQREREERRSQPRRIGFVSERLEREAVALGQPVDRGWGWIFWDRREFHFHSYLGFKSWIPAGLRRSYRPHWESADPVKAEDARQEFGPLANKVLDRHLELLSRLAADARRADGARMVLVETPWLDQYEKTARLPGWARDEARYVARREAWSAENGVPWLDFAEDFSAASSDFVDPRHVGQPELRRRFVKEVALALKERGIR